MSAWRADAMEDVMTGVNEHRSSRLRPPIFIVGTERSGSNALRIALDAHSQIASPHPPHLLRYLAPIEAAYGDLSDDRALRRLIDDALRIVRWHINPWVSVPAHDDVRALLRTRDLLGVNDAIHGWYAINEGKSRWACKSTFSVHYIGPLNRYYPGAKFVWLVRDPRDVAASSKSSVFNPSSALTAALLWCEQQSIVLDEVNKGQADIRMFRYEDLTANPVEGMKAVCDFIGEPFSPGMLDAFSGNEARRCSGLSRSWANVGRPISDFSVGSYRSRLSAGETSRVEAVTGELMSVCGYATSRPVDPSRLRGTPEMAKARAEAFLRRLRIEARSAIQDKNFILRWRRDLLVSYLSLARQ
jgi:hypothetical protein